MINSNDSIGNLTRALPACSVEPQLLRHRVLHYYYVVYNII